MEKYIPDIYQKSIYSINYDKLRKRGIKCILFDLDNTLVPITVKDVDDELKNLIYKLKDMGMKTIIFSNSSSKRVEQFKQALEIEGYSYTFKPFAKKINDILKIYKEDEIAIIGDQMITDVALGNKIGITTILVNPISKNDKLLTKFNRKKEKHIMTKLRNNNLFVKGRYYE
ncbi:MAG: YqeG family HAD IIIA-type phosphatase [Bacilli bacterium]|nr:YqeG family HAD IIIA-type phosphatase [Bacilli bacterium]